MDQPTLATGDHTYAAPVPLTAVPESQDDGIQPPIDHQPLPLPSECSQDSHGML